MDLSHWTSVASVLTAFATIATLVVLIWYTVETHKLRTAAERQLEHAAMPLVMLEVVASAADSPALLPGTFVLHNVGNGPAFDIRVSQIEFPAGHIEVEHANLIAAGARMPVMLSAHLVTGTTPRILTDFESLKDALSHAKSFWGTFSIHYDSLSGDTCFTACSFEMKSEIVPKFKFYRSGRNPTQPSDQWQRKWSLRRLLRVS